MVWEGRRRKAPPYPDLRPVGRFARAGLAVGEGAVWLPDHGRSMIYKIDPGTNRVVMEIPAGPFSGNGRQDRSWDKLAVGEGSVWAIISNNELRRYSATDGTPEAAVSLPSSSSGVIVAFGSVWVTRTENDELYRIDPKTNQIAGTIELHSDPRANNEGDGTDQRIDGKSGDVVATIDTGAIGKGSIAVGGSRWTNIRHPIRQRFPLGIRGLGAPDQTAGIVRAARRP